MSPAKVHSPDYQSPVTNTSLNSSANNSFNLANRPAKINANDIDTSSILTGSTSLANRFCRLARHLCCLHVSPPNQATDYSPPTGNNLGFCLPALKSLPQATGLNYVPGVYLNPWH